MSTIYVHIDGQLIPKENATVPFYDHSLLYGDGLFEGIRSYNGKVFKLDEHLTRLYNGAKALAIQMRDSQDVMRSQILDLCKKNDHQSGYIRITVSRGTTLGLDPKKITGPGHVYISTEQLALYPVSYYENGLDMITVSTRAMVASVIEPRIKSTGKYVSNVQAKLEANRAGVGEGVVLNLQGFVTECTGDNLFVVKDGVVRTPPEYQCGLAGITRATVILLAKENDIPLVEVPLTQFDIYIADECFLTGTGAEIVPAVALDGRTIGTGKPGPLTGKLMELFKRHTKETGVAF